MNPSFNDETLCANGISSCTYLNIAINIVMKQFRATVRASGVVVATVVYAENVTSAIKILQAQFGAGHVISVPAEIQHAD
jgi:hypothetical protein